MIQPLRTVHRRAFFALAALLPAVLVLAVAARSSRSRINSETALVPELGIVSHAEKIAWKRHSIPAMWLHPSDQQGTSVIVASLRSLNEPDVLLYWTAAEPQADSLPADAIFLAAASGQTISRSLLPSATGYLVLYSQAHRTVVDTAALEKQP